jgi:hypothetical protein
MERGILAINDWLIGPGCPAIHRRRECVISIWARWVDLREGSLIAAMSLPPGNPIEHLLDYSFDTRENALRCISSAENQGKSA